MAGSTATADDWVRSLLIDPGNSPTVQAQAAQPSTLPPLGASSTPGSSEAISAAMGDWEEWENLARDWLDELVYGRQRFSSELVSPQRRRGWAAERILSSTTAPPPQRTPREAERTVSPSPRAEAVDKDVEFIVEDVKAPAARVRGPALARE
eukprot:RCo024085